MLIPRTLKTTFKELIADKWFLTGLGLKIILALFFASEFLSDLFVPFIKSAVSEGFFDVYTRFVDVKPNAFPYPPVMLYILAVPRAIMSLFTGTDMHTVHFTDLFAVRIPLLIADILLLTLLTNWLKKKKIIITWYWFNPIILYITYIHGQLDIIPVTLLVFSLYFLFKNKYLSFVILLALACCTKINIIITIPFLLIYLYKAKKVSFSRIIYGALLFTALVAILNFPFITSPGYIKMVYQNEEQGKVFGSIFSLFQTYHLVFIPAFYLIILYSISAFKFLTKDLLMIYLALSFGIFTFFIVPRQGWYLWNIPFFIYFLVQFKLRHKWLFIGLNIAYFIFFIISPLSDFPRVAQFIIPGSEKYNNIYQVISLHGMDPEIYLQLSFTLLQTLLLLFCYSIFVEGIWAVKKYKIFHQPYLIGICGDSATGKSTLSEAIGQLLGNDNVSLIRGDDTHKWERGHDKWNEYTHLNPMANWLHKDLTQLINLKSGKRILRAIYDHDTGKFTPPLVVEPKKIVVYEGMHTFYLKGTEKIYDLKIFMKPDEELRREWKVDRDVKARGYTSEKVIEQIEKRLEDSQKYIHSQEGSTDIVFSLTHPKGTSSAEHKDEQSLQLNVRCANDIYYEDLIEKLRLIETLKAGHIINKEYQLFSFSGTISKEDIENVMDALSIDLQEILENTPRWNDGLSGIMQLFIAFYILNEIKNMSAFHSSDI